MDFQLNEEQRMLAESLRRYLESEYNFEHRRRLARNDGSFSRATWHALADLGVLGLGVDPAYGGFGESSATQMLVQHELGRALLLEPVTPSAVMATAIFQAHGSEAQKAQWLPAMATGERILTLAYLEQGQRDADEDISTFATPTAQGYSLTGRKTLVWHGEVADALLVSARVEDGGVTVFLVPRAAPGVQCRAYPTLDGQCACDVSFQDVTLSAEASVVGSLGAGMAVLESGLERGIAALCAEAGGVMERLIEMTGEYLRTRQQFGRALGSYQALQHRMADMLVQKELAVSMAYVAAQALDEAEPAQRRRMLAAAKFMMAKAGRFIGQQAVQLHGGMGMTDELAVGDYFKRLTMLDPLLGDSDSQLARYAELLEP
ncbi:acyl-CoA dehydrogenase [Delftia tsuruhatensis]|uniref:acyl-CoA dehydrogenase family protein n=1 Tax=Delftia tsuruhatensis TaxID=180282 RepID=UPI003D1CD5E2